MKRLISRIFTAVLVAMTCFAIPGPLAWGESSNVNASTNCAAAPNPDECMREQTLGKWTSSDPLNYLGNRDLIKSGPFTASVKYDDQLSWILGLGYVHMLGEAAGLAMKVGLGLNELRANITGGWAITDKQQIKATYEYLKQNLPFDFASGTVNEWVGQNALGGAYQYIIRKGIIHSLELSGSYVSAGSKDLPEIMFYQDAETQALNLRRIAGGKQATGMASVNLMPRPNTSVILGAGYSGVNYDTQFENDQNARAIAFKAEIAHIINPRLKVETGVNNTASSTDSKVSVSKILPKNLELAVTGQYSQGRGNIQDSKTVMLGLSYPAPKSYALSGLDKLTELKNWIEKPVVYMARVLAVKDEVVSAYVITTSQDLPDQAIPEGQPITTINTQDYFQFDPTIYDQVTYTFTVAPVPNTPAVDGNDLNLELVQNSPYQATLQSAAPLPYGTSGQYSITITATGEKKTLQNPVVKSDTFILTVQPIGPGWTDKTLPTAPMGGAYPAVDLNDGYALSNIPNDTFTFSIVSGPSWLQVTDGHVLTAVDGSVVPQNITSVPVTLKVVNSDNQPSQKDFNVAVNEQLPIWSQSADYQNWFIAYDDTSAGIPLQSYITTGNTSLTFSFANNQLTSGNWMIVNENGNSYLRRTTPSSPPPADIGTTVNLSIVAHNTTSSADNQEKNAVQKVAVNVLQDSNLPAPSWNSTQLNANAGDTTYKVALAPLVNSGVTGDSYTFTLDNKGNTWLQLSADGQSLVSNGAIPPVGTGDSGNTTITLKALSFASNKDTTDTTFTVTVTNFAPIWADTAGQAHNIAYDATPGNTAMAGLDLNGLISKNNTDLNFAFSSDGQKKTSDDGKWTIVTEGNGYVLRLTQADSSLVGTTVPVKVYALNSTSNGGAAYDLPMTIISDATQPGASWNDNKLTNATAGTTNYNDAVKKLFDCPAGDICSVTVDLKNTASWLGAQPNSDNTDVVLSSKNPVPAAASDDDGVSDPLQVTVVSRASGKQIQKDFTIPITNVLPEWISQPTGDLMFDGKSTDPVHLNPSIDPDTRIGISFVIDPSFAGKDSWTIINNSGEYYLQRTAAGDVNDINNSPILVPIIAKNTTSQASAASAAKINVIEDTTLPAPVWNNTQLAANAGDTAYKVDLTPLVNGSVTGDSYTFTLDNKGNTWLQLSADGKSLVSNGAVQPIGAGATGDVKIMITALSNASGKTTAVNDFTVTVTNFAPIWADAIPTQNIEYDAAAANPDVAGIGLNTLIKANNTNLNFAFSADGAAKTSSDGRWTIVADGNGYALKLAQEDVSDIGKMENVQVFAFNSTSNGGIAYDLPITIIGDASQPGADWNNNALVGTTAGTNNYSDAVKKLFDCPAGDICTVTVDLKNTASWLAAQPNANNTDVALTSTNAVPAAASDKNGVSDPIEVTVTSLISGKQIQKDFTIPVTNVLPEWSSSPTGSLMFDGNSPNDTVHLNPAIKDGTNMGLSFVIDPNFAEKNSWQIIQNGSDYYLQRTATGDVNDIDKSPISVSLLAKNTTSQDGAAGKAIITVTVDSTLNPAWNSDAKIEDAYMGFPYGDASKTGVVDLNTKITTPGVNDTFKFTFDDSVVAHPTWLSIDANGHLVSDNVPTTASTPFSVAIKATSEASGNSVTHTFTNAIIETLPAWATNPTPGYQDWQIAYDDTDQGIELSQFVASGATNLTASFANKATTFGNWKIVNDQDSGKSYLRRTTAKDPMPTDVDTSVVLTLVAHNTTSTDGNQEANAKQDITIKVLPGTDISPPVWNSDNLPNAYMGFPYGGSKTGVVDLTPMVKNPDVSNDKITFSFDDSDPTIGPHPAWLMFDPNNSGHLITDPSVNGGNVPKTAMPFSIKIIAASEASGETTSKVFSNVQIVETPAKWQNVTQSAVQFDLQEPVPATTNGLYDWIDPASYNKSVTVELNTTGQSTCSLTNYTATNWAFDNQSATKALLTRSATATPIDVNTVVNIPVLASNDTSNAKVEQCVPVEVKPDTTMDVTWTNATLDETYAGSRIGTYRTANINDKNNGLFYCNARDICQIDISFDTSKISWLQSNISDDKTQATLINKAIVTMAGDDDGDYTDNIKISVTSLGSGKPAVDKSFNIYVNNVGVRWKYPLPAIPGVAYDGASPTTTIKLNDLVFEWPTSAPTDVVTHTTFSLLDPAKSPNWKIETVTTAGVTESYLVKTGGDPSEVGTTVEVDMEVGNDTSTTKSSNPLMIPILPDTNLQLDLKDNNDNIAAADMGYNYASKNVTLNDYVVTKDGAGNSVTDSYGYTTRTDAKHPLPAWLTIDSAGNLSSNNTVVPRDAVATDFDVDVKSQASGQTTTLTFHIDVNTVAPVWGTVPTSTIPFTSNSNLPTDQTLTQNLTQGGDSDANPSFRIDPTNAAQCANYVDGYWTVSGVYVQRTPQGQADYADGSNGTVNVPVIASNITSPASADVATCVPVNVTPDGMLQVIESAPLPPADMGEGYGQPQDISQVVNLNGYVQTTNGTDTYMDSYQFVLGSNAPDWLVINNGNLELNTTKYPDGVPQTAPNTVTFDILVTSAAVGAQKTVPFSLAINQSLPVWDTAANYNVQMAYDDQTGILLNPYVTAGSQSLSFTFKDGSGNDVAQLGNWIIYKDNSNYYLRRSTNSSPVPDDLNKSIDVKIYARNTTSSVDQQDTLATKEFTLTATADSGLPAPSANGAIDPAYMGFPYGYNSNGDVVPFPLSSVVQTVGVSGDTYEFTIDTTDNDYPAPPWLAIDKDGNLISSASVPLVPNTLGADFSVKIIATSLASGKSESILFTAAVNQTLPVWDTAASYNVQMAYDDQTGILLNPYVTAGSQSLSFTFKDAGGNDIAELDNWLIFKDNNNYYLRRATSASPVPADIGIPANLTIYARNNTSSVDEQDSKATKEFTLTATADIGLPAPTLIPGESIAEAYMGYAYGYDGKGNGNVVPFPLSSIVQTVGVNGDTYEFEIDTTDNDYPAPTWLTINNGNLVSSTNAPEVPTTVGTSFSIKIKATSKASGNSTSIPFDAVKVNIQDPVWQLQSAQSVEFTDKATPVPNSGTLDDWVITPPDNKKLSFSINTGASQCAANFTSDNWNLNTNIINRSDKGTEETNDMWDSTNDAATIVQLPVLATNATSPNAVEGCVPVKVLPNAGLTIVTDGTLPAANMGYNTYSANLNDVIATRNGTTDVTDTYQFEKNATATWPAWLTLNADGTLSSNADVPRDATIPTPISVDVTSTAAGVKTTLTLDIAINTVDPAWNTIDSNTQKFTDGTMQSPITALKDNMVDGTNNAATFTKGPANTTCAANFVDNNWAISADGQHVVRTSTGATPGTSDTSDIGTTVQVPVVAINSTSPTSVATCVPVNVTADADLTVSGSLPDAQMGYAYNVDLKQYVKTNNGQVNDSYTFTAVSLPDWLSLDPNTGILSSTGSASANGKVPTTADVNNTSVTITVQSKANGGKTDLVMPVKITTQEPEWNTIPASTVEFTQKTAFPTGGLNSYLQSGTGNDASFVKDESGVTVCPASNYIAKNWDVTGNQISRSDAGVQDYSDVNDQASVYVPVLAFNSTSPANSGSPKKGTCVQVTVNPDPNYNNGPEITGKPTAATAGDTQYSYTFINGQNNLFTCPSNDTCVINQVDTSGLTWLQATITADNKNANLTMSSSATSVPYAQDSDSNGNSSPFTVTVKSLASGRTVTNKDITIPITNILPVWQLPGTAPQIKFDGKDDGINLNQYIQGYDQPNAIKVIMPGANFDTNKWQITEKDGVYTLVKLGVTDTSDIGKTFDIPLLAYNNTSIGPQPATLSVSVIPDNSLAAPSFKSNPTNATAGMPVDDGKGNNSYKYNLINGQNDLFTCPANYNDICTIESITISDSTLDWLKAKMIADGNNQNTNATLYNASPVPVGPNDDVPTATAQFTVKVVSKASGNSAVFTTQVPIANVKPQWITPPSLSINDDDLTTPLPSAGLPSLISDGTDNLTFALTDPSVCTGTSNYNAANWNISSVDTSIHRAKADVNDQFKTVQVPVLAKNSTSINGATKCIPVDVVGKLTFITTNGNIKFDAIGEDSTVSATDLTAQGGFDITAAVSNADKYSNLKFDWGNGVAAPDYWQIKQGDNNHYYILRNKKNNGGITQVSAAGVGGSASALNIRACYGDTTTTTCVSQPINMTLQGDPALTYSASSLPSSYSIDAQEPFIPNKQSGSVVLTPGTNVKGFMPATTPGRYQVIGDESTYVYNATSDAPSFIGANLQKLDFYFTTFDNFKNKYVYTGNYLQVSTAANNMTKATVTGMPSITVNQLYITPPASASASVAAGYSASGVVMNTKRTGSPPATLQQSYMYLNVKNLSDGQYYLSQIKANFPSGGGGTNIWQQVCPGLVTDTPSGSSCGGGTSSIDFSNVSMTNQKVITGGNNSGLTFLASRNGYSGSTYPSFDTATSIIISYQPITP